MSDDRTLTEKETVKALCGHWEMGPFETPTSFLSGKWHAVKGGYWSVRPTGLERHAVEDEKDDIPHWVDELGLKQPERFSDKLIKKTNRHAVLLRAREVAGTHGDLPDDFKFMADITEKHDKSMWNGSVDAIEISKGAFMHGWNEKGIWYISIWSIILPDYLPPFLEGEMIWKNEEHKHEGDDAWPGRTHFKHSIAGNYDTLVFKHVERTMKPVVLKSHEDPVDKIRVVEKVTYPIIGLVSTSDKNADYIDNESKVNNDVLKFTSGCVSHPSKNTRIYY